MHVPRLPARIERDIPFVAHPEPDMCGIQAARIAVAALAHRPPPPEAEVRDQIFSPALGGTPLPLLVQYLTESGFTVDSLPLRPRAALAYALDSPNQLILAVTPPGAPDQRSHIEVLTGLRRSPPGVRRHTPDRPDVWMSWPRLRRQLRQPGGMLLRVHAPRDGDLE